MIEEIILEKIEIDIGINHNFFYTGYVSDHGKHSIRIKTIIGEDLIFRVDQVVRRQILKGDYLKKAQEKIKENETRI